MKRNQERLALAEVDAEEADIFGAGLVSGGWHGKGEGGGLPQRNTFHQNTFHAWPPVPTRGHGHRRGPMGSEEPARARVRPCLPRLHAGCLPRLHAGSR